MHQNIHQRSERGLHPLPKRSTLHNITGKMQHKPGWNRRIFDSG